LVLHINNNNQTHYRSIDRGTANTARWVDNPHFKIAFARDVAAPTTTISVVLVPQTGANALWTCW
jgi:hypothetical protein